MKARRFLQILIFGMLIFPLAFLQSAPAAYNLEGAEISFMVKHPFKDVLGKCKKVSVSNRQIVREANRFSATLPLQIRMEVEDIRTGNRNRDSHMLEVLGFPGYRTITVTVVQIKAKTDSEYEITGEIMIKGVKKNFSSSALVKAEGNTATVIGKISVRLSEFNVERPALLMISIEDAVNADFIFRYRL